jgi:hypothetical protein
MPTDATVIDLERLKELCRPYDKPWRDSLPIEEVNALIAAVEALRERVAYYEGVLCLPDHQEMWAIPGNDTVVAVNIERVVDVLARAAAAEARVTVLEGAAQEFYEAVALGPLDAAAKYGPDFDLDEHLKAKAGVLYAALGEKT